MTLFFAKQLKQHRQNAALSQEAVAEKLFVSRQAVSRWESGDATPELATVVKLAALFECSLDNSVLAQQPGQAAPALPPKPVHKRYQSGWDFAADYWWLAFATTGLVVWCLHILR